MASSVSLFLLLSGLGAEDTGDAARRDLRVAQANNVVAAGQTLTLSAPVTSTTLSLLGSADAGAGSGTAVLHYSDGSSQNVTLAWSDWALNGSGGPPGTIIIRRYFDKSGGSCWRLP